MKFIPYFILFFCGGWVSKESCDYYYRHHIVAIDVKTGEQKEVVLED